MQWCTTISYFSKLEGVTSPVEHPIMIITKDSFCQRLGYKNQQKLPLMDTHMCQILEDTLKGDLKDH